jgi:hypothetical protein
MLGLSLIVIWVMFEESFTTNDELRGKWNIVDGFPISGFGVKYEMKIYSPLRPPKIKSLY